MRAAGRAKAPPSNALVVQGGHAEKPSKAEMARGVVPWTQGAYSATDMLLRGVDQVAALDISNDDKVTQMALHIAEAHAAHEKDGVSLSFHTISAICVMVCLKGNFSEIDVENVAARHLQRADLIVLDKEHNDTYARVEKAVYDVVDELKRGGYSMSETKIKDVFKALLNMALSVKKNKMIKAEARTNESKAGRKILKLVEDTLKQPTHDTMKQVIDLTSNDVSQSVKLTMVASRKGR